MECYEGGRTAGGEEGSRSQAYCVYLLPPSTREGSTFLFLLEAEELTSRGIVDHSLGRDIDLDIPYIQLKKELVCSSF